jgi:hypothetical protein
LSSAACGDAPPPPAESPPLATAAPAAATTSYADVERAAFNRLAAELDLPLFWIRDANDNRALEPDELAVLWGVADTSRSAWVGAAGFTAAFDEAYGRMLARQKNGPATEGLDAAELARRKAVREELDQGRPTLVHSDFTNASPQDRAIVANIVAASTIIERLHAKQIGSWELRKQLPDHAASRMLFYRNQGPWCEAPATEANPDCNAIASKPPKISGLYPAKLQKDPKFCDALAKQPNGEKLRHQFHVVREKDGALIAVPYNEAYADDMRMVSEKLEAAAAAITEGEAAFKGYLLAAAQAFSSNDWEPADEAWAKMNAQNSKWYLRIAPDEVYFEPCSLKAGFHISFARINQDSLAWQTKLDPVKGDMEKALAALAGPPYKAREVSFKLPDFIDIILNAGDARAAQGGTIGQSLPNWGPVGNEGRGRTVAMTNLYTDPDSLASRTDQAKALLCPESMELFSAAPEAVIMGTVFHEAAHNLGPAHEYKVKGKKATQIFGGPLASTLEELKAQTAALFFTDWLHERKLLTAEQVQHAHLADIVWTFGHISRGMYTPEGKPKPYSQLAAIQLGHLVASGALVWRADSQAANRSDQGCFHFALDEFPKAVKELMAKVAHIKGSGDLAAAEALKKQFVDVDGDAKKLLDTITERWLRAPKGTFVYAIDM